MKIENINLVHTIIDEIEDMKTFISDLPTGSYRDCITISSEDTEATLNPQFKSKFNKEFIKKLKRMIIRHSNKHLNELEEKLKEL